MAALETSERLTPKRSALELVVPLIVLGAWANDDMASGWAELMRMFVEETEQMNALEKH